MDIQLARHADIPSWLALAVEVEHLFGPMAIESGFHEALKRNIERGSAFCIRDNDGGPGTPLLAGLLFSSRPPIYQIGWLCVASRCRRRGLGRALVLHVMDLVRPPAELTVKTFGPDVPEGEPARRFYQSIGFSGGGDERPGTGRQ